MVIPVECDDKDDFITTLSAEDKQEAVSSRKGGMLECSKEQRVRLSYKVAPYLYISYLPANVSNNYTGKQTDTAVIDRIISPTNTKKLTDHEDFGARYFSESMSLLTL